MRVGGELVGIYAHVQLFGDCIEAGLNAQWHQHDGIGRFKTPHVARDIRSEELRERRTHPGDGAQLCIARAGDRRMLDLNRAPGLEQRRVRRCQPPFRIGKRGATGD